MNLTAADPMKNKIELLAPGGDLDSIKTAVMAGADAVYLGLKHFNARDRAGNIELDDLYGIVNLAHRNNCKVFLTLNIIIIESEIQTLIRLLNRLVRINIDGLIVQDTGLFYILSEYFKSLEIHASTQCTTHNRGQISFLERLGVKRVNLSRELNIKEISDLTFEGRKQGILTEVFVHGSYCICFSGLCYMSSVHKGKSGNRGRCSQPCRDKYLTTPAGRDFPLNLKDNSAYCDLKEIMDAGVASIKIEGRMKSFDYVYTVVNSYREAIDAFYDPNIQKKDMKALYQVFNRDFSNGYLKGIISRDMFIDNPRDYSIRQFKGIDDDFPDKELVRKKNKYYDEKESLSADIKPEIESLSIERIPLDIIVSGKSGLPLKVIIKTAYNSFTLLSKALLRHSDNHTISRYGISKRLNFLNTMGYRIQAIDTEELMENLFIPFKDFTSIIREITKNLTGVTEIIDPVSIPNIKRHALIKAQPSLFAILSSEKDLYLCNETPADICFKLPDCLNGTLQHLENLFKGNRKLIPWFPTVLIGEDYNAAVKLLLKADFKFIVTNNTGIAFEACKNNIPWIAGPFFNLVNSFSLLCLKEKFNCIGAFVSNEMSRNQLRNIRKPDNFGIFYSIYHPVLLMTSRQCLFHQVTGCEKDRIDENCMQECEKSALIKNLNGNSLFIHKTKGDYHTVYNSINFLNTDIIKDLPGFFSGFSVDLRDVETETRAAFNKAELIKLFQEFINQRPGSQDKLKDTLSPFTSRQYIKGI